MNEDPADTPNETRLERWLERWVARAVTPRGAAIVIASATIAITFAAGDPHDGPRPRELPDDRIRALVGRPDDHDGRVRRQRSDDATPDGSSPRSSCWSGSAS